MSDSAYLIQVEQKIQSLISNKKYREAYNLCVTTLNQYPKQKVFEKLKEKIEDEVEEANKIVVEKKMDEVKKLWKEEKYSEILTILKDLQRISPDNRKVEKKYRKAQDAYLEKIKQLQIDFERKQNERLDKILNETPELLGDELFSLETNNPSNPNVKNLVNKFKDKLIAKLINEKKELLKSNKFDAIGNFLDELRKIETNNPLIIKLGEEINQRKYESEITQQSEFIYGGSKHLDTLMKLEKFDKAIIVAKEILAIDPNNKEAEKILQNAERKLYKQSRNLSIDNIYSSMQELKDEYLKDKSKFIKL